MKIVLTGGGTAGHIMPNIALASSLKKHFDEILYIGSHTGMESTIAKDNNINFKSVTTVKLKRSLSISNLTIPFKLAKGTKEAKRILKEFKPDVIFSKGGFVAVPVCIAGKKLGIPIVGHESDLTLGLANKIIYKKANTMCTSFEETCKYGNKCVCTGTAIRPSLLKGNKEDAIKEYNLNPALPTILVTGGSLGAVRINKIIADCLPELTKDYNVIHMCGKNNLKDAPASTANTKGKYIPLGFVANPANIFACADLVISRAGSNSIFEFLTLHKPMILLPLSKSASRGDQILNAKNFKNKGYASVILDEDLTPATLLETIKQTFKDIDKIIAKQKTAPSQNGTENILNEILKTVKKG